MTFFSDKVSRPFKADPQEAFWTFSNFRDKIEGASEETIDRVRAHIEQLEERALAGQKQFEKVVCRVYANDKKAATRRLSNYSHGAYRSYLKTMVKTISDISSPE